MLVVNMGGFFLFSSELFILLVSLSLFDVDDFSDWEVSGLTSLEVLGRGSSLFLGLSFVSEMKNVESE